MDETFDDFLRALTGLPAGTPAVVATLVGAGESRKPLGRRAIFLPGSEPLGSVTLGGCAEGALRRAADEVRASGQPRLLDVNLGSEEAYEFGMTCAGQVTVQLVPTPPDSRLWTAAAAARARGEVLRLVTPLGAGGTPLLLTQAGEVVTDGTAGSEPDPALAAQAAALPLDAEVLERSGSAFLETRLPPAELVIVGAGPIAAPLSRMARTAGLRVTVCDDRPGRLNPQRLPDAHALLLSRPDQDLQLPPLSARSSLVIISHDYGHEVPVLRQVLGSDVPYVAMVASRRRGRAVLEFLAETGVERQLLERVRSLAGLDLNIETPAGIALSILAELTAVMYGGSGQSLSQKRAE
ncbi:XdhC family protein [Deinococcus sp. Marseille-Q6407]|uniref:XdhC family protein n=1 Tax=Deinococcus sp. Marseille-Q6407 TaxID=2969223 RepID=UPI0021BEDB02|nr:XdhC/CoxI family protein [Deinococcus sp. Marseille-Q6407]